MVMGDIPMRLRSVTPLIVRGENRWGMQDLRGGLGRAGKRLTPTPATSGHTHVTVG
jgi:hypothetical protein